MTEARRIEKLSERAVERMAAGDRADFLAALAWELTLAGRGLYPPPATPVYEAARPSIGLNEALHRTAEQLKATLGDGTWAAPDEQLIAYLVGQTRAWGQTPTLLNAIARALDHLARADARRSTSGVGVVEG